MAVEFKDYYETLGVSRTAGDEEIKRAFRKLARKYHPDVAKDKKAAEEKFKEVNEAYEVLSDPAKRKKYDELGANWKSGAGFQPPPGWEPFAGGVRGGRGRAGAGAGGFEYHFGGTGFSDFFEQLFGAGARGGGGHGFRTSGFEAEEFAERGRDVEGDLLVTLDEAMHGAVRSVSVRHTVACAACGGAGERSGRRCAECDGEGRRSQVDSYQVKIPAGVTENQRLRLAGRGEAGFGGAAAGDLYLRVRFARHPEFDVEGHDLVHELELAPWEAVLGATLSVRTLTGEVSIRVPPGTQQGTKLRVRGHGLTRREGGHGDLIVVARVRVPVRLSERERDLWKQLARDSTFRPRE